MKKIIKTFFILLILFGIFSVYSVFNKTVIQNNYDAINTPTDTIE